MYVIPRRDRGIQSLPKNDLIETLDIMEKTFYVYILASRRNGTLYVGVTSDLLKRVWEHKNIVAEGFTEKYGVDKLVYYERFYDPGYAIRREKRLKKYNREWKKDLIESSNPEWKDLFEKLTGGSGSNDPVGR